MLVHPQYAMAVHQVSAFLIAMATIIFFLSILSLNLSFSALEYKTLHSYLLAYSGRTITNNSYRPKNSECETFEPSRDVILVV